MKIEAAITTSLALFNLQLGRCDQPSQGPPKALRCWQWRQRAPQRQSACAVLTGVPIHITPLASMIQWPPRLPLLFTARRAVPLSIARRPRETADRLHSPLKLELEDLIKTKKVPLHRCRLRQGLLYAVEVFLPLVDETQEGTAAAACLERKCFSWGVENQERDFQRVRTHTLRPPVQTLRAIWLYPLCA